MAGRPTGIDSQNDIEALRYRGAADHYYAIVGRLRVLELSFVLISVCLALYSVLSVELQYDAAFSGFCLATIDASVIYYYISLNRRKAAQCSELFDAYVFGSTERAQVTACLPYEEISAVGDRRLRSEGVAQRLRGWYSISLAPLGRTLSHLGALRLNAAWDTALRNPYVSILWITAVVAAVIALYLFGKHQVRLDRLVTNFLFPVLPASLWFAKEIADQIDARNRKVEFRRCVEDVWQRASSGSLHGTPLDREVDELQATLFSSRIGDVSVPGWLYDWRRDQLHIEMDALTKKLLSEVALIVPRQLHQ